MERMGRERIIENFRIIINSLYEHQNDEENSKIVDNFKKELKNINGDLKAEVEIITKTGDKIESLKYKIDDVAFDGFNLPEKTEFFEVCVNVKSRVRVNGTTYYATKTIFKSMLFVLSENVQILTNVNASQGIRIVNNMALYSELTGNRIRFGEEVKVEL